MEQTYIKSGCKICKNQIIIPKDTIQSEIYFTDNIGTTVLEGEAIYKTVYRYTMCPVCDNKAVLYVINYIREKEEWVKK